MAMVAEDAEPLANTGAHPSWTPWATVAETAPVLFTPACLRETLLGGQAFRWRVEPVARGPAGDPVYVGVFGCWLVRLTLGPVESDPAALLDVRPLLAAWPAGAPLAEARAALTDYLAAHHDWAGLRDALPWRSDPVMRRALDRWPTLRLLRQPLGETLLAFLCSSNKQVVQIAQCCEALAQRLGEPLPYAPTACALPTWQRLAETPEAELRACALGYRAAFVAQTARWLAAHPDFLPQTLPSLPYAEAHAALQELPGVGPKVADCVLLFGAHRWEAFPVDVWVQRALAQSYGLGDGWSPVQLAQFGRIHFGPFAGFAQQVLFAGVRAG